MKKNVIYPNEERYHMPAEWNRHERTLISWPVRQSMQHPEDYDAVCSAYAKVAKAIAAFEPVTLLINEDQRGEASEAAHSGNISLLEIPHDDAWIRDNGPTFLIDGRGGRAAVNWGFNAWGGKYPHWELDDAAAPKISEHFGARCFDAPLILEGGSIHTDGEGTLLTTEQCLLNPSRNPSLTKSVIENYLKRYLNVSNVIWLKKGLAGDETDGHVDNIACFAAPGRVLMQVCDDPGDENYEITLENLEILQTAVDAGGRKIEIIPITQPPVCSYQSARLTLSYLNFYLVNGGVILPVFGGKCEATDRMAEDTLRSVFPDRTVVPIDGMPIIKEGGNVHCITQQVCAAACQEPERSEQ